MPGHVEAGAGRERRRRGGRLRGSVMSARCGGGGRPAEAPGGRRHRPPRRHRRRPRPPGRRAGRTRPGSRSPSTCAGSRSPTSRRGLPPSTVSTCGPGRREAAVGGVRRRGPRSRARRRALPVGRGAPVCAGPAAAGGAPRRRPPPGPGRAAGAGTGDAVDDRSVSPAAVATALSTRNAPRATRGRRTPTTPMSRASSATVATTPPIRTGLSFSPNVSIANSLSGRGVASTARLPTASSGEVTPSTRAATASEAATAATPASRPASTAGDPAAARGAGASPARSAVSWTYRGFDTRGAVRMGARTGRVSPPLDWAGQDGGTPGRGDGCHTGRGLMRGARARAAGAASRPPSRGLAGGVLGRHRDDPRATGARPTGHRHARRDRPTASAASPAGAGRDVVRRHGPGAA